MSAIRVRSLVALAVVQFAFLTACRSDRAERAVIERWLLCEECTSGELEAVVTLGDRATDRLDEALRNGPSRSDRDRIRHHAASRYAKLRTRLVTQVRWINHYDSSFVAHYQAHAATALGRIGTARARYALLGAMQRDSVYWPEVRRALAFAAPVALAVQQGDGQGAPPDSFVRVAPAITATDSASGVPLPNVRVVFRVDSGNGRVTDSVQRTNVQGFASVGWALGPGPDSFNVLRASAFRANFRFHATAHGPTPRLVFLVQPTNGARGQPITPPVRVAVVDAWNQPDTTLTGTAEAMIVPGGLTVTGPADSGRVDFAPIIPEAAGSGFRIVARLTGATEAVSVPFDIAP